jgi:hypothetical protein
VLVYQVERRNVTKADGRCMSSFAKPAVINERRYAGGPQDPALAIRLTGMLPEAVYAAISVLTMRERSTLVRLGPDRGHRHRGRWLRLEYWVGAEI